MRQALKKLRKPSEQKKLEFMVALAFSLLIVALSTTELGYIPISPYRSLDMSIIPALFAAMIGGYRVGIPVAAIWAITAFTNDASHLQSFTLYGLLLNRLVLVVAAIESYKWFRKKYQYSPMNVYRAAGTAIIAENIVSNSILLYILVHVDKVFIFEVWARYTAQILVLEMALSLLAMKLLIGHLRQVHILNGVKRKIKAQAKK